jgi:hypothetical protein
MLNRKSECIPRRFCLTPVVQPVGSASAARVAASFNYHSVRQNKKTRFLFEKRGFGIQVMVSPLGIIIYI